MSYELPDYKPNTKRYREEQRTKSEEKPKVEKVVSGNVRTKKKGELGKLRDVFISEDVSNVKSYIVMDVLVPAAKKAISDIVRDGIDMILYGEAKGKRSSSGASYVSYRNYSDRDRYDDRRPVSRTRSNYDFDDVILDSRVEAEEVLIRMDELIDTYGQVTVADMYDLVGMSCQYTDNSYGWKDIRSAEPVKVRGGGYLLKMPRAIVLKN